MRVIKGKLLIVIMLVLAFGLLPAAAQAPDPEMFDQTGHSVGGAFLKAYHSIPESENVFGYPITEAIRSNVTDSGEPRTVQYFDKVRFELISEQSGEPRIAITPLGEIYYQKEKGNPTLVAPANSPACRLFAETGYRVCFAFLDFFDQNGGLDIFGNPISDIIISNDRYVQYFERARFEWHPELPSGQRVVLTDLGYIYFRENEAPDKSNPIVAVINDLKVRAFVNKAVIANGEEQVIYIIVQNQNFSPVPNAQVSLGITAPSGTVSNFTTQTNELGIASIRFDVAKEPIGLAEVKVTVDYGVSPHQFQKQTRTFYRIWW
jgi:hypothetical protein